MWLSNVEFGRGGDVIGNHDALEVRGETGATGMFALRPCLSGFSAAASASLSGRRAGVF
jgi:hypothetical protein